MIVETRNNGLTDVTVLLADEGMSLYCNFLEEDFGSEVWLGYVHYGKDGEILKEPYLLTPNDFSEIEIVVEEENEDDVEIENE